MVLLTISEIADSTDNVALSGLILQQQHMLRLVGDGRPVAERGVASLAVVPGFCCVVPG
jgi:hypothetical protein